jgi:hypothetical protein
MQLGDDRDSLIVFSFIVLIIFFSYCLFVIDIRGGSLFKVYFTFCYLFLGVIPLIEYRMNVIYWTGKMLPDEAYLTANILLIILTIVFLCFYLLHQNSNRKQYDVASVYMPFDKSELFFPNKIIILGASLACLFAMLQINNFSLLSLLFRGGELNDVMVIARWQKTLITTIARFVPIISFGYCLLKIKENFVFKFLLFIIAIICASPFGIARFMVATLYLPLLFILFPSILKNNKFPLMLLSSIFFIFPFLENFRNFNKDATLAFLPKFDFFLHGHFDSYQSIVRVISEDFITFGWQLLGAIFFFIPRFFWPSKPIGSGAQLAQDLNYDFTNISMNIYGEGYVNFGLFGCILFASILGVIFSKADYWFEFSSNKTAISIYVYYLTLGFLTMLLRGDLMTAISSLTALLVCSLFVKRLYPI